MRDKAGFRERLGGGVILCDGAMGTYLHRLGIPMDRSFPELCLSQPKLVERVHREYVAAGAELLKTNSYGAHRLSLERYGLGDDVRRVNIHAARLARQAARGGCYVAGVIGPLGRSLAPLGSVAPEQAREIFREQIEALAEGGVDLIMIETISDLAEFDVALAAAREACDLPIVVHKTFTEDGRTLMGELPHDVVRRAREGGADVVGANCTVGPQRMLDIIERMAERAELPLSAQPTAGLPRLVDGRIDYHAEPGYMARYARRLAEAGAVMVGACCGSTPAHIEAMAAALSEAPIRVERRAPATEVAGDAAVEPLPLAERSRLGRDLGRRFVVAVELALPRGHDLGPTLDQARQMRELGVDTLVLSDALQARLFAHPLVVAYRLQQELGVECLQVHATRDKNVLGLQSDLLAAHVLGVRNVIVSVADPANFGDYPTASTLSDVGATGLVRILDSMNRGLDLAGNGIGEPTAFVPLVTGEPSGDPSRERDRLARYAEHGAVGVVTRPVFDLESLEYYLDRVVPPGLPVIAGVLPLRSAEQAAFLHHEVPGIRIPEALQTRLAEAADPAAVGLAAAKALLDELPARVAGVHLIPPYRKGERILQVLRDLDVSTLHGTSLSARGPR